MISTMEAGDIKDTLEGLGADLCGIAPVERFRHAPAGFHPAAIYQDCESVVVFAKRIPVGPLFAASCIPYTHASQLVVQEVDYLGLRASRELERLGVRTVLIPTDVPYEHWEADRSHGRGILSLRHAAWLAGLGTLGKNTLLRNDDYGSMLILGAILMDTELEGDPIVAYEGCLANCDICIDACPVGALDGETVDQSLCRPLSNHVTERGFVIKKCNACLRECPHALGF